MPAANPQAREDAQAFMRRVAAIEIACCPHCRLGRWRVVEHRGADRAALARRCSPTLPRTAVIDARAAHTTLARPASRTQAGAAHAPITPQHIERAASARTHALQSHAASTLMAEPRNRCPARMRARIGIARTGG